MISTAERLFQITVLISTAFVIFGIYKGFEFVHSCKIKSVRKQWYIKISFYSTYFLFFIIVFATHVSQADKAIYWTQFLLLTLMLAIGISLSFQTYINENNYEEAKTTVEALADAKTNIEFLNTKLENAKLELEEQNRLLSNAFIEQNIAQDHIIEMDKMASLGQVIQGISQKINQPMKEIENSFENAIIILKEKLIETIRKFNSVDKNSLQTLLKLVHDLFEKNNENKTQHKNIDQHELIEFLNKHDIANSNLLADQLAHLQISQEQLELMLPYLNNPHYIEAIKAASTFIAIRENNLSILKAAISSKNIILSLKRFAHFTQSDIPQPLDVKKNLETALILYYGQLDSEVKLKTNFDEIKAIDMMGFEDDLIQVWTNLIQNAFESINGKGEITINLASYVSNVVITFSYTGHIADSDQHNLFQPIFIENKEGRKLKLGLYFAQKIIEEKHKGAIQVTYMDGKTVFTITLPRRYQS